MFPIVLSLCVLIPLDQFTKYLARLALQPGETAPLIPPVQLCYIRNTGAAFSFLSGVPWGKTFLIVFTAAALAAVAFILFRGRKKLGEVGVCALVLILSGGIGNLIDRIALGYVVDFFATTFIDFPVFNVADCFISIGVVMLAVSLLFRRSRDSSEPPRKIHIG